MAVVLLVLRTLYLAHRQRFDAHRRIARWTLPVWLYVSVTGIVVYAMLYAGYPTRSFDLGRPGCHSKSLQPQ